MHAQFETTAWAQTASEKKSVNARDWLKEDLSALWHKIVVIRETVIQLKKLQKACASDLKNFTQEHIRCHLLGERLMEESEALQHARARLEKVTRESYLQQQKLKKLNMLARQKMDFLHAIQGEQCMSETTVYSQDAA